MYPELKVSLTITGNDIDPQIVTDSLQLEPTKAWRKGDRVPKSTVEMRHDGWQLTVAHCRDINLSKHVRTLVQVMMPLREQLERLRTQYGVDAEVSCVIYASDEMPIMHFDVDTIESLALLRCECDIDLMLIDEN